MLKFIDVHKSKNKLKINLKMAEARNDRAHTENDKKRKSGVFTKRHFHPN